MQVRALWVGGWIPPNAPVGSILAGTAVLSALEPGAGAVPSTPVRIVLRVSDEPAVIDHLAMDADPAAYTRLRWLDSPLAIDHELVAPYPAVEVAEPPQRSPAASMPPQTAPLELSTAPLELSTAPLELSILNREVHVGADGLPRRVMVRRPASAHGVLRAQTTELLGAAGVHLSVWVGGERWPFIAEASAPTVIRDGPGQVHWWALSRAVSPHAATPGGPKGGATMTANVSMSLGLDGYMDATLALTSVEGALAVEDVVLGFGVRPLHGLSRMGMDHEGAPIVPNTTRSDVRWRWSTTKRSSSVWLGSAAAGIRLHLKGEGPLWDSPQVDPSLPNPAAWGADGRGGCNLSAPSTAEGEAVVAAFTGPTILGADALRLSFDLLLTPFKTPNETLHWALRHYQVRTALIS